MKTGSEVTLAAIGDLVPFNLNPRKSIDIGLDELTESIKQHGVLVPLLVRPMEGDLEKFEVIAGHRRLAAAHKLKLTELPIRIRLTKDDEALQLSIVDNLQRQDVHPLDEARGFEMLLEQVVSGLPTGSSGFIDQVAKMTNKPAAYIARRLQLNALIEPAQIMYRAGVISLDHVLLLCRISAEDQERALKFTLDRNAGKKTPLDKVITEALEEHRQNSNQDKDYNRYWEPASAKELKAHIENTLVLDLKKAPWDLKDRTLVPVAGSCYECPKRTGANNALFGDLQVEESTCMDAECYRTKLDRFVDVRIEEVGTKIGRVALRLSYKHSTVAPRLAKDTGAPNETQVFKAGQYVDAKKGSCEHVLTGVMVDYEEGYNAKGKPGAARSGCVTPKCKAHPKAYERSKSTRSSSGPSYKEQQDAEKPLRRAIVGAVLEHLPVAEPEELVRQLMEWPLDRPGRLGHGSPGRDAAEEYCRLFEIKPAGEKGMLQDLRKRLVKSAEYTRAVALLYLAEYLDVDGWDQNSILRERKELIALTPRFGVNVSKLVKEHEAKPEKKAPAKKKAPKAKRDRRPQ